MKKKIEHDRETVILRTQKRIEDHNGLENSFKTKKDTRKGVFQIRIKLKSYKLKIWNKTCVVRD